MINARLSTKGASRAFAKGAAWLFLLSFVGLGAGLGVLGLFFLHVVLTGWWSHDVPRAHAIAGFAIGAGAIVHTLLFGVAPARVGLVETLCLCAVLHTTVYAAACGAGFASTELYAARLRQQSRAGQRPGARAAAAGDKGGHEPRPAESAGQPAPQGAWALLCEWRMCGLLFVFVGFMFCGMSMKMLLSTLFEQAFALSHLHSTYLSALCLVFYWACRTLAPLAASGDRVFALFAAVLLLECAAYALTPIAIRHGTVWLYTVFRVLSGGGFATLTASITPLTAHIYGMRDLDTAIGLSALFEPIAGTGAAIAWVAHVSHADAGGSVEESYNGFFFACSAIVGLAALVIVVLARQHRGG